MQRKFDIKKGKKIFKFKRDFGVVEKDWVRLDKAKKDT